MIILFLGSLPWSFISVISWAGGEVATLQNGSCKKNSRQTGLQFCFFVFQRLFVHLFRCAPRQFIIMAWLHKPFTTTVSVWCQRLCILVIYTIYRTLSPAYSPVSAIARLPGLLLSKYITRIIMSTLMMNYANWRSRRWFAVPPHLSTLTQRKEPCGKGQVFLFFFLSFGSAAHL